MNVNANRIYCFIALLYCVNRKLDSFITKNDFVYNDNVSFIVCIVYTAMWFIFLYIVTPSLDEYDMVKIMKLMAAFPSFLSAVILYALCKTQVMDNYMVNVSSCLIVSLIGTLLIMNFNNERSKMSLETFKDEHSNPVKRLVYRK
jgi:hypothetical protein